MIIFLFLLRLGFKSITMLMNKIFTKTQYNQINKFIDDELELIEKLIILNKKSCKKTKKNILDYSKSLCVNQKKNLFILN